MVNFRRATTGSHYQSYMIKVEVLIQDPVVSGIFHLPVDHFHEDLFK